MRIVGHRFSKETHDLRDFLARNRVPGRWYDVERDPEAKQLLEVASVPDDRLPVAFLEDGSVLERPTRARARRAARGRRQRPSPITTTS